MISVAFRNNEEVELLGYPESAWHYPDGSGGLIHYLGNPEKQTWRPIMETARHQQCGTSASKYSMGRRQGPRCMVGRPITT